MFLKVLLTNLLFVAFRTFTLWQIICGTAHLYFLWHLYCMALILANHLWHFSPLLFVAALLCGTFLWHFSPFFFVANRLPIERLWNRPSLQQKPQILDYGHLRYCCSHYINFHISFVLYCVKYSISTKLFVWFIAAVSNFGKMLWKFKHSQHFNRLAISKCFKLFKSQHKPRKHWCNFIDWYLFTCIFENLCFILFKCTLMKFSGVILIHVGVLRSERTSEV